MSRAGNRNKQIASGNRLIVERAIALDGMAGKAAGGAKRGHHAARSVSVNLAESPLGWLRAHGHVDARQFDAGERLRCDYERAQLDPRVTMSWDGAPVARGRGSASLVPDLAGAQFDARRRFAMALDTAGPGLGDILWRIVCAGEGMRQAETALGWPARAGKLVLRLALDRIADHYRLPLPLALARSRRSPQTCHE